MSVMSVAQADNGLCAVASAEVLLIPFFLPFALASTMGCSPYRLSKLLWRALAIRLNPLVIYVRDLVVF